MKTRTYTLKGKDVPQALQGAAINFRVPETQAELLSLCKSEADALELGASAYDVWLQGRLRAKAGQKDATAESLNEFAASAQYQRRTEGQGTGGSKPKTPKGIQTSKAAGAGNRLFEKCLADSEFLARMIRQQIVDQAEFDAWKAAREASKTPATAAPAASTTAASTPASAETKTPARAGRK
jgi:hypothetical protein